MQTFFAIFTKLIYASRKNPQSAIRNQLNKDKVKVHREKGENKIVVTDPFILGKIKAPEKKSDSDIIVGSGCNTTQETEIVTETNGVEEIQPDSQTDDTD